MLQVIDIHTNQIDSPIPPELGNLKRLIHLDLSFNELCGTIPPTLAKLRNLTHLNLESNAFNGSIPPQFGNLKSLAHLDLSFNNLFGKIPHELESLLALSHLRLATNTRHGSVPNFKKLSKLNYIDLSYNHLTGKIPNNLAHVPYGAFIGNEGLEKIDGSRRMSRVVLMTILIPMTATPFIFYFVLGPLIKFGCRMKSLQSKTVEKSGDFLSIWNYDGRIAYEDIINATEDFDIKYCIGTGGYGSLYRARLPNGKTVALKKLHRLEAEDPSFDKSFRNEVKHLTKVRHRSIIKLHGFCLHKRCMFLVYEYMERGSLFCALRDDVEAVELDWSKRLEIIWDMAHALSYLHHDCARLIVHRDISSNNILLDNNMQAFLSDFGKARLLEHNFSSNLTANVGGAHGYMAPGEQQSSIFLWNVITGGT
ncbi:MDIS1-interacting receptor like kinase 2-like [Syzygium oleosum]|uniref:MDIS1-interacting receptor like kinase 2-like n=1 Tax=Syzygium oleosum TaxID=219896 RepID=UPI0024BB92EE|nr:MDIS1-interacting receptor like kinase 2-like [Syzygium oleosum]